MQGSDEITDFANLKNNGFVIVVIRSHNNNFPALYQRQETTDCRQDQA